MNEFKERRIKDERGITPCEILEGYLKRVDELDNIVVIAELEEEVECEYSSDDSVKMIGLIETGKNTIINSWQV